MHSKNYVLVYLLAFCFILISSVSDAEPRAAGGIGLNKPIVSPVRQELKPLQQTFVASQFAVPSSYQLLLLTIDNIYTSMYELGDAAACSCPSARIDDELHSYYKPHIKNCLAKSYSIQDQQAAGCAGTDTVNQCMDKLYKYCIGSYKGGTGNKEEFKNRLRKHMESSNNISVKSKKYSDQLQNLLNNMP